MTSGDPATGSTSTPATMLELMTAPAKPVFVKLSILIPVYNEERYLAAVVKRVVDQPIPGRLAREIIMVNDASKDRTWEIMQQLPALFPQAEFKLLNKTKNGGKGAALRDAWSMATGDLLIVQDADFEYDPADYPKLLQPILDGKADVVFGSRFAGSAHRVLYFWHTVGNRALTTFSNMVTDLNLTDMETCYKVFRREVIQSIKLEENRFGIEPEMTAKLAAMPNLRIYEVPISYDGRTYAEGKKIGVKDGFRALYAITKYGLRTKLLK